MSLETMPIQANHHPFFVVVIHGIYVFYPYLLLMQLIKHAPSVLLGIKKREKLGTFNMPGSPGVIAGFPSKHFKSLWE
jgi:hypothetical protein